MFEFHHNSESSESEHRNFGTSENRKSVNSVSSHRHLITIGSSQGAIHRIGKFNEWARKGILCTKLFIIVIFLRGIVTK